MSETGLNVPPSNLEDPKLYTNPYDAIQFKPSAFVVVESQLGTLETKSLTSSLAFTALASTGLAMEKLTIDLAGTYNESGFSFGGTPVLQTSLSLDPIKFTIGGITKTWSPSLAVTRDITNGTWGGRLEVSKSDFQNLFSSPTLQVTQLGVESQATVSATAQWGSANSYLTFLSFTIQPVPEPNVSSLFVLAGIFALKRKRASY